MSDLSNSINRRNLLKSGAAFSLGAIALNALEAQKTEGFLDLSLFLEKGCSKDIQNSTYPEDYLRVQKELARALVEPRYKNPKLGV